MKNISDFCKRLRYCGRILELEGWNVWCCSPVYGLDGRDGPDGKVHVLFSRWRGEHRNWVTECEVAHAVADRPEGPYTVTGAVLQGRGGDWWDANTIHNPTIQRLGDRYVLFYIGNNIKGLKWDDRSMSGTQRIGLAVADRPEGPWRRVGDRPILDANPDARAWDGYIVVNPALLQHPNGQFWLYYKAWDRHNDGLRKMGVAIADRLEGPYERHPANPLIDFSSRNGQVEDAYVWREDGRFHIIMRDQGYFNTTYGLYMDSPDGIHWGEPQIAYMDTPFYTDEPRPGLDREGRFERPQLLMKDGRPEYLFCAFRGGKYRTSSAVVLRVV